MNKNWQFKDPENTAVFTTAKVLKDKKPILHVSHDEDDGAWQFHTGEPIEEKDSMVVSLKEIVEHDASIVNLADLPLGWQASRKTINDVWFKQDQHGTITK